MSTRELAYSIIDRLSDKQLEGFVLMFQDIVTEEEIPNAETIAAIEEGERMLRDPKTRRYSAEEALRELKA